MDDPDQSVPARTVIPAMRVVGFPGPFADWVIASIAALLGQAGHQFAVVNDLTDDHAGVQLLLGLNHASTHRDLPIVVCLDNPDQALQHLVAQGGDVIGHTRALTAVIAGLNGLHRRPDALVIRPANSEGAAGRLAALLGVGLRDIAPPPMPVLEITPLTRQIADDFLTPIVEMVLSGTPRNFLLPRECLMCRTHEPASAIVEIAGPARPLYFGPFFHFPPGAWEVELELWFSHDVGDASFAAEFFTGVLLSRARMRPGKGGWYQAVFPVLIDHPETPMELRIWVERGAIEGQMGLRQIKFRPITPPP